MIFLSNTHTRYTSGFISLTSVLVVSALFFVLSIGVTTRSIAALQIRTETMLSDKAAAGAHGCASYALMQLMRQFNYEGGESVVVGDVSCQVHPIISEPDDSYTIHTEATVSGHPYRVIVNVARVATEIEVTSYRVVTSF